MSKRKGYDWIRDEFRDRMGELEHRAQHAKRTGVSVSAVTNMYASYAYRAPAVVCRRGRLEFYVITEMDEFRAWIAENAGTRSRADVLRATAARLEASVASARDRVDRHRTALEQAKRDLARHSLKAKQVAEDLEFLKNAGAA